MSAAASTAAQAKTSANSSASLPRWLMIAALVLASAVIAGFVGINDYSGATRTLVGMGDRNAQRFEAVYRDAAETKVGMLRFGVDLVVNNPDVVGAFARDDRDGLMKRVIPLYNDVLKPRYGLSQFNFWTPPAKLYLRAIDPAEFGTDGSAARRSIVQASERRAPVYGMEAGLGGILSIRAMTPIYDGTKLVGVVEMGDDVIALLGRSRETTGVDFAVGLDRKRSEEVERKPDPKADVILGTDVFFRYSNEETHDVIRGVTFDPRNPSGQVLGQAGKTVYIKPFIINNFANVPTVVVATVFDMTDQFVAARQSAMIKGGILLVILAVGSCLGYIQFGKVREGFTNVIFGERRKLEETSKALANAQAKLKDVDLIKQGFFTNLTAAVAEPLQAVSGQLQACIPEVEARLRTSGGGNGQDGKALGERLSFALKETSRLTSLISDYRQIELFRQKLVKSTAGVTKLDQVISSILEKEQVQHKRLPLLRIASEVAENLPPARADESLIRWSLSGLLAYAIQGAGSGTITIAVSRDKEGWLRIALTGSAYANAGAPTDALLESSRQFITRISEAERPAEANGTMMALVLSRMIAEYYGGSVSISKGADASPGFVMLLPAAA